MNEPFCAEHPSLADGCGACTVVRWALLPGNLPRNLRLAVVGKCFDCGRGIGDTSERCRSCARYQVLADRKARVR